MTQYTVMNGSILMPNRKMAHAGDVLSPEDFKGYEKNLQTLLKAGKLKQGRAAVQPGLDATRGAGDFRPIPEIDPKKPLTSRTKDKGIKAKLDAIKASQAARAETQAKLAEHEGEELTLAEAQAHGLV